MKHLYPVFLDLNQRLVVVIGAGLIGKRKIETLINSGAIVRVVSPEMIGDIRELANSGKIEWIQSSYHEQYIRDAWLVIASTDDQEINQSIYQDCCHLKIFCNVVDKPEVCTFQVPSILQRGALKIAISTGGISPALARRIRERLEPHFGRHYTRILDGLQELRHHVKQVYPDDQKKRSQILKGFVKSEALDLAEKGDIEGFNHLLEQWKIK